MIEQFAANAQAQLWKFKNLPKSNPDYSS